jgi:biotin synthase
MALMTEPAASTVNTNTQKNWGDVRFDWDRGDIRSLFQLPFMDLIHLAQSVHRANFDPNKIQLSTLMSIKTGSCPEDCKYCPQSGHYNTGLETEQLAELEKVREMAQAAKDGGATRFCMGAAWKHPSEKDFLKVLGMVKIVKDLEMETCMTLGALNSSQSQALAESGLDYYTHNLDTSPEFYGNVISTRSFEDRLQTIENVRDAGIKVCCGGILGMGEEEEDRVGLLQQLAKLSPHPESVPINMLVKVKGTPLANEDDIDAFEFIKTVAVARIIMPRSYVRLSAGRTEMSEQTQALCFLAGANSIFYGEKLLTTDLPQESEDLALFKKLGLNTQSKTETRCAPQH